MKKILCMSFLLAGLNGFSQREDLPWNIGIHGGFADYSGELGNDFYRRDQPFYGHVGFSVSRYLMRHLDATILYTYGDMGHFENDSPDDPNRKFLVRVSSLNALLKYNILSTDWIARPYVFIGASMFRHSRSSNDVDTRAAQFDASIPTFGAGINIGIGRFVTFQVQEMLMYTSSDDVDFHTGGGNDIYLFHTAGLTFNFTLKRSAGAKKTGVGDIIDKCTDVSKKGKKVKP
jgi:hypothetical protein